MGYKAGDRLILIKNLYPSAGAGDYLNIGRILYVFEKDGSKRELCRQYHEPKRFRGHSAYIKYVPLKDLILYTHWEQKTPDFFKMLELLKEAK